MLRKSEFQTVACRVPQGHTYRWPRKQYLILPSHFIWPLAHYAEHKLVCLTNIHKQDKTFKKPSAYKNTSWSRNVYDDRAVSTIQQRHFKYQWLKTNKCQGFSKNLHLYRLLPLIYTNAGKKLVKNNFKVFFNRNFNFSRTNNCRIRRGVLLF